jgi:hypothetical protein
MRKSRPLISTFPILGQLPPTQLLLGDALEPGALEVVRLNAAFGRGPLREQALEHAPWDPDHAAVLADLGGLPLGIQAGILGSAGWETVPHRAILLIGAADEEHAPSEVRRDDRREERSTSFADEVIE